MQCKNHASMPAADRCAGCAEPFCPDCLVDIQGQKYCGSCKVLKLKGGLPLMAEEDMVPCSLAQEALTYSILSTVCCAVIFAPVALSKASQAKAMIKADPRMTGSGKVLAASIISIVTLLLFVLGIAIQTIGRLR